VFKTGSSVLLMNAANVPISVTSQLPVIIVAELGAPFIGAVRSVETRSTDGIAIVVDITKPPNTRQ